MSITWNPLDKAAGSVLSEDNLTITSDGTLISFGVRATEPKSSGKWYWECINTSQYNHIGISKYGEDLTDKLGNNSNSYSYEGAAGYKWNNSFSYAFGDTYDADVIGVALDLDNGKIWFSKNGIWQASGIPSNGVSPAFEGLIGEYFATVSVCNNGEVTVNFGQSNFVYGVPEGFSPYVIPEVINQGFDITKASYVITSIDHNKIDEDLTDFPLTIHLDEVASSLVDSLQEDSLIFDEFSGTVLNSMLWDTYIIGDASVTVDSALNLSNLSYSTYSGAKVHSREIFKAQGVTTLTVDWLPHKDHYYTANPPSIVFASPNFSRDDAYGDIESRFVKISLGGTNDTTDRTVLKITHADNTPNSVGDTLTFTPIDIDEVVWHTINIRINWETGEIHLTLDNSRSVGTIIPQDTLTAIGNSYFIELATSDLSKHNTERFKNLSLTSDLVADNKFKMSVYSGETQLPVEIECWEPGNHTIHTKVPIISATVNTELFLYYDATQEANTEFIGITGSSTAQAVWDDNTVAMYTMAQDPVNGSASILDSTSNTNHLVPMGGMTPINSINGPLGKALDADGIDDSLCLGVDKDFSELESEYTITVFLKVKSLQDFDDRICCIGPANIDGSIYLTRYENTNTWGIGVSGNYDDSNITVGFGTYQVITWRLSSGSMQIFHDNKREAITKAVTLGDLSNTKISVLSDTDRQGSADFIVGYLVISKVARSDAWVKAINFNYRKDLIYFYAENKVIHTGSGYTTNTDTNTNTKVLKEYIPASNDYLTSLTEDLDAVRELYNSQQLLQSTINKLGSFWYDYFVDTELLNVFLISVNTLLLTEYRKLLKTVLATNIISMPADSVDQYNLFTLIYDRATYVYSSDGVLQCIEYPIDDTCIGIDYFITALFSPKVILVSGVHYEVHPKCIKFYVDIFNDNAILSEAYQISTHGTHAGTPEDPLAMYVMLWTLKTLENSKDVYNRFSNFMYKEEWDSKKYKETTEALQYFFTQPKTIARLESAINMLLGVPNSITPGEKVIDIYNVDNAGNRINTLAVYDYNGLEDSPREFNGVDSVVLVTDAGNTYTIPSYATLLVNNGDILDEYQSLGRVYRVEDHISNPEWYYNVRFPWELVSEYTSSSATIRIDSDNPRKVHYHSTLRSVKDSSDPEEQRLFSIMDVFEKDNIIHIQGELSFAIYTQASVDITKSIPYLKTGLPAYEYLMRDNILKGTFIDEYQVSDNGITDILLEKDRYLGNILDAFKPFNDQLFYGEFDYHTYSKYNKPLLPKNDELLLTQVLSEIDDITHLSGKIRYSNFAYGDGTWYSSETDDEITELHKLRFPEEFNYLEDTSDTLNTTYNFSDTDIFNNTKYYHFTGDNHGSFTYGGGTLYSPIVPLDGELSEEEISSNENIYVAAKYGSFNYGDTRTIYVHRYICDDDVKATYILNNTDTFEDSLVEGGIENDTELKLKVLLDNEDTFGMYNTLPLVYGEFLYGDDIKYAKHVPVDYAVDEIGVSSKTNHYGNFKYSEYTQYLNHISYEDELTITIVTA